jgi:hypothetical protein
MRDQRLVFGMATPVLLLEEGRIGFSGIFARLWQLRSTAGKVPSIDKDK